MKTSSFFTRYKEILLGVFFVLLGGFYLYESTFIRIRSSVAVNARLIPQILGVMILVLGVIQLISGAKYLATVLIGNHLDKKAEVFLSDEEKRDVRPIVLTFILIILYAVCYEWLGFVISSTSCMFFQMMILTPKSAKRPGFFLIISFVVAMAVYVTFRRGLNLMLPEGVLWFLPI